MHIAEAPATQIEAGTRSWSARQPLSLQQRLRVHNTVVQRVRAFLQQVGYEEIPVPELTPATGSCEVVDSMFSLDYFGALAFPRQTGQLVLEEVVAAGVPRVYCEGESLRRTVVLQDGSKLLMSLQLEYDRAWE